MNQSDITLRGLWRELPPTTRKAYQEAWRRWTEWCGSVGVGALTASQTDAQAWVDSQIRAGAKPNTVRARAKGVRQVLEYLAMLGHRPHEPFALVALPALPQRRGPAPMRAQHETLSTERLARALYATRGEARAHCLIWCAAGMGLSASGIASMGTGRIVRVGDTPVAVIQWRGKGHLVPVPREVMLVIEQAGWPVTSCVAGIPPMTRAALAPHLATSVQEMRRWHQTTAIALGVDPDRLERGADRLRWSTHPSVIVCAHLRDALIGVTK